MKFPRHAILPVVCLSMLAFVPACEDDDGGGSPSNGSDLIVCIGDSITQGYACDGAPYPSCLASITGRRVLNYGVGGVRADAAPSAARKAVAAGAGYVCILYGSNDAIHMGDPIGAKEQLRSAIHICKDSGAKVVIGTPPPMIGSHGIFNGRNKAIVAAIRELAGEEHVPCADLNGAFGDGQEYLVADGLHPNAAGAMLIAKKFKSKL